ncbi:pyridoxal phosphate-dependent aminotransferase [Nocardia neocaledoniensis]|uniref:pyridoxal phosphate-dependent aminotransferase n=1 Tax=Nocardia neocaledoniensis TaxID=236511 RepID=UPI00245898E9|nr:pyridoxal phosphate-dependent aminotransferase [Nocardia neocaledoniensis]
MSAPISHRAAALSAHSYDDFPCEAGHLDMRGDNSPPLTAEFARPIALPTLAAAGYGDIRGELRLRTVLGELFGVCPDQVMVTGGGSEALWLAMACVSDYSGFIRVPRPGFPGFEQLARLLGLRVLPYGPGAVPGRGRIPVVVCTPHNPTGIVTAPNAAGAGAGWVIWDLSHMSTAGHDLAEFTAGFGTGDIAVFSLSKLLRLPGARVGCLVVRDPELLAALTRAKTHTSMSTSCLAQGLALRVLQDAGVRHELIMRAKVFADHRAQLLDAVAAASKLRAVAAVDGTHLYLETTDGGNGWERLAGCGVIGIPGTVFNGSAREVRLCIAQPQEVIDAAAARVTAL